MKLISRSISTYNFENQLNLKQVSQSYPMHVWFNFNKTTTIPTKLVSKV